ncbi:MAG TPA: nitroreductase family protein [Nitrospirales bacterium]|nr:nitroreductase family protein [Nitrospirales bacterium]
MEKPAPAHYPVHELIGRRWSPRAFADRPVEPAVLCSLFEAARWAASSSNEQPWHFLVAAKADTTEFERLLSCLTPGNARWVKDVPVLMMSVARMTFEDDGKPNRHAFHDVGQAVATLAIEATALGLFIHQMAGFYPDKVRELFKLPADYEPVAAIAVGYPGEPERLPDDLKKRERQPRERKPIADFVFTGAWKQRSTVVGG